MNIRIVWQRPGSLFVKVSGKGGERKDLAVAVARLNTAGEIVDRLWFYGFDKKLNAYAFLELYPEPYRILVKRDSTLLDKTLDVSLEEGEQKKVEIVID